MKKNKFVLFVVNCIFLCSCSNDDDSAANLPPNEFSLVQVVDNATNTALNPKFSWTRSDDPNGDTVTYSILLGKGEEDPTNVLVSDLQTTNYSITSNLEINTKYRWQVVASDGKGATKNSEIFSFTTRANQSPGVFNLLQVENNENNIILNPTLIWEESVDPDDDPITYKIMLEEGNLDPMNIIADNLQSTSFLLMNDLDYDTTYSWRVIASDNAGNSVSSEIFSFTTRKFQETLVTSEANFSTRTEHGLVGFSGKLWVIGGYHASNNGINGGLLNDVWSSPDGINWTEDVSNNSATSFTPRTNHTTIVFQNKIWVIGGGGINSLLNDVWSSSDGITWNQETQNATFPKRYGHTSVVFNNKLWVIGGRDESSNYLNDVWSSTDGINWVLENDNANFMARGFHSSIIFQNKMWIIGGFGIVNSSLNDVWSSSDGINWALETVNADFAPRNGHSSTVYKNRIWVIAGDLKNDFWSSKDGINWRQETEVINFSGRGEQANTVLNNKLWIVGGWMGSLLNDVWSFE